MRCSVIGLAVIWSALSFVTPAPAQSVAAPASQTAPAEAATTDPWSDTVVVIKAPSPTVVVIKAQLHCPEMWKLEKGDSIIWLMPTLTTAPASMAWDSSCFERLLRHARVLVMEDAWHGLPPAYRYLPDGKRLKDVVSVESYARYLHAALRVQADPDAYDRLTPQWAAYPFVGRIFTYANVGRHAYPDDMPDLAAAAHVPTHPVDLYTGGYEYRNIRNAIKDPQQAEACLNSELDRVNWLLDTLPTVVAAWQKDDMRTVLTHYPREDERCFPPDGQSGNMIGRENMKRWTKALAETLKQPGMAVAAVPLDFWLYKGGALDQLHAAGVTITLPADVDADLQGGAQ